MTKKLSINNLLDLQEERMTRKTINLGEGDILIYEPTEIECKEIINYIRENNLQDISAIETVKYLLPLLTNLDLEGLSDDKLYNLLNKKPLWLQLVKAEIQSIVNQICNLQLLETMNQIQDAENLFITHEIIQSTPVDKMEKILNLNRDETIDKTDRIIGLKDKVKERELEFQKEKELMLLDMKKYADESNEADG